MMRRRCVNSPYQITTVYGNVPGYPLNNGFHTGVDYISSDSLIVAPMDSVISATGYDSVNGNYLVLDSNGYRDWFSHIKEYKLKSGSVKAGQVLAVMGATGAATGVHVHHSLRVNGVMVDPEKHLSTQGGDEVIPDQDNYYWRYNKAMQNIRGRQMTREEFRKNFVGRSHLTMLEAMLDDPEADKATDFQQWALTNRTSITKQVTDQATQIKDLQTQTTNLATQIKSLTETVASKGQEIIDLKAKLAVQSEDTQLLNGFGEFLRKMITRLGLK
jgi:septal ring factor EnvC (AmiA/AmiB activator)